MTSYASKENENSRSESGLQAPECARRQTIFLVGFMGAGKTSVGRELGQSLGWVFEDLDDRVQMNDGRSIEQIFRESGEAAFRHAEHTALQEVLGEQESSPRVVALGGGAFVQAENAALLECSGAITVFLDAPVEELHQRCAEQGTERPLRRDAEQFSRLYEARRPHYMKATLRIETSGKNVEEVAAEIGRALKLHKNGTSRSAM